MATRRRLDRKCKDTTGIIDTSDDIIEIIDDGDNLSSDARDNTVVHNGVLTSSENTPKTLETKAALIKEEKLVISAEDENDSSLRAKKRKACISVHKESSAQHGDQVSDDESDQLASKKLRLLPANDKCSTSASESVIISTDEQKLRSELTVSVLEHAKKCDLKDFTCKVRETIWTHFYDENSTFAQIANNRPIPGFEIRSQQIQQAKGTLSQLFKQIRTPTQLSLFVRDYSTVLKLTSLQRFHDSLLSLITEHETHKSPRFFDRFCAIQ